MEGYLGTRRFCINVLINGRTVVVRNYEVDSEPGVKMGRALLDLKVG